MAITVQSIPLGPVEANTHILTDTTTQETAVIDAGACNRMLLDALAGKKVRYILLTHGHFDHILGVAALKKTFPQAEICIHQADAACLTDADCSLASSNCPGLQEAVAPDRLLQEGDVLPLGTAQLTVLHTPGHSKGSVCFMDKENRLLFSGDTLFCLTAGRTDLPGGSAEELLISLMRLRNLEGDFQVYTGHNRATTLAQERVRNRYLRRFNR